MYKHMIMLPKFALVLFRCIRWAFLSGTVMLIITAWTLNPSNNHFYANRTTDEVTGNKEFEMAVNWPSLTHCETFVIEAKKLYCKGKSRDRKGEWHFLRHQFLKSLKPTMKILKSLKEYCQRKIFFHWWIDLESVHLFSIV